MSLVGARAVLLGYDKVVLEVGSLFTRAGVGGESEPRFAGPRTKPDGELAPLYTASATADQIPALCAAIEAHLRDVFFRRIVTDPKQRRVVICENMLMPLAVKEALATVLFRRFQASAVSFYPAPVLALLAVGRHTGLVIDCGNLETVVTPVIDGRPVISHVAAVPIAGMALRTALRETLRTKGAFVDCQSGARTAIGADTHLPDGLLEAIVYSYGRSPGAPNSERLFAFDERCSVAVPTAAFDEALDSLFAPDDADDRSIPRTVAEVLLRATPDQRGTVAAAVQLTGGLAAITGFRERLVKALVALTAPADTAAEGRSRSAAHRFEAIAGTVQKLTFAPSAYPRPNLAWIGASLAAFLPSAANDVSAEAFEAHKAAALPDWVAGDPPM